MAVAGGIVASGAIGIAGTSSISTLFVEVVDDMAASDHWLEPSRGCALTSEVLDCEPPPRRKEPKRDLLDALWGRAEWLTCPRLPFFHLQMAKATPNRPPTTRPTTPPTMPAALEPSEVSAASLLFTSGRSDTGINTEMRTQTSLVWASEIPVSQ